MMALNHRMFPPSDGHNTTKANGRTYTCAIGSSIDVPDFDAVILKANGWTQATTGGTDSTANRPVNPPPHTTFYDTTLSALITYDASAKVWRNVSGTAV